MNANEGTVSQAPSPPDTNVNQPQSPQGDRPQSPPTPPNPNTLLPAMTVDQFRAVITTLVPAPAQVQAQTSDVGRVKGRIPAPAGGNLTPRTPARARARSHTRECENPGESG
jgi:hypothetical protein